MSRAQRADIVRAVRESLTSSLRCPRCDADGTLRLAVTRSDEREVQDGEVVCGVCGGRFAVKDGIVDLLLDPPGFVTRERAGLGRFAEVMRTDGWTGDRILALPDVDLPYWRGQRRAMDALLGRVAFRPGERLLDVGSNTCWASNIFARLELDVVALDIATTDLQGLSSAEHFLNEGAFFERVLSVMFDPALAGESMDYVFCCEVLHHNDPRHLRRTFRELYRVLRPGGLLLVVNEPMRFPLRPKLDHGREVAEFAGNEHVYFLHQYLLAARLAGFRVTVPALREIADARGLRARVRTTARLAWRNLLRGDTPLALDCRKPPLRAG